MYVRRAVARAWGVPPWVVDEAPVDEVLTEIKILNLEGENIGKSKHSYTDSGTR